MNENLKHILLFFNSLDNNINENNNVDNNDDNIKDGINKDEKKFKNLLINFFNNKILQK